MKPAHSTIFFGKSIDAIYSSQNFFPGGLDQRFSMKKRAVDCPDCYYKRIVEIVHFF